MHTACPEAEQRSLAQLVVRGQQVGTWDFEVATCTLEVPAEIVHSSSVQNEQHDAAKKPASNSASISLLHHANRHDESRRRRETENSAANVVRQLSGGEPSVSQVAMAPWGGQHGKICRQ